MSRFTGKKAVVTGGTHGIGLATVRALLDEGATVLLTGRDQSNLDAARRDLGPKAIAVRSDTSFTTGVELAVDGGLGQNIAAPHGG